MKLRKYLNESTETDIQKAVNSISKAYNIPTVKVKFTNKQLSGGRAYYQWSKIKGGKIITPINITMSEWKAIKEYPDEWMYVLAHEIAHHVLAQTDISLRHTKKHDNLANKLEKQLIKNIKIKPKLSSKQTKDIKDKLEYWLSPENKMELIDAHGQKTYDKEIKIMQDKV